ncbi:MAG: calcium sensor EFh [Betaproteobacteria bacterium]|nr:calcium sensor EFh [Betaproteobacteria bacterium]
MFKPSLIAALILVPAVGFAAENTADAKGARAAGHFSKADTDRNGKLSRTEVDKALPHLARKFDSIDRNKDGQLSRGELYAWKKAHKGEWQAKAAHRFGHADADGDGAISRAEAGKHAPRLAKKFDRIDSDRDGRLTQDELRAYREMMRGRERKT